MIAHTIIVAMKLIQVGFLCVFFGALLQTGRATVDPEVYMNTSQLIISKGYPCEEHDVVTSDGYILTVHRIPHGVNASNSDVVRPVALLWHPLLSCSACWVENLANESLGFLMADAGFDVWLGNSRGNTYARRHKSLSPDSKEFWAFSWDEMALYDVPATVDKILKASGASEIFYVGHSQGGSIGYAGFSANATLASKVKMFAALAPGVYVEHMESPVRKLTPLARDLQVIADLFGFGEFMPYGNLYKFFAENVCNHQIPGYLCENILFLICGFDATNMNESRIPVYIGQHPAGTSVQNIVHFAQMVENAKFQMFDYGIDGNKRKYNQTTPPVYDIVNMDVPVMMFHGTNDWLVSEPDIYKLENETKNLVSKKLVSGWEHLDFIWAMNAPSQCYSDIISTFKQSL